MKKTAWWVIVSLVMSGTAWAEPAHPILAMTGGVVAVVGVSSVLHFGRDNVRVLGDTYCVSDYAVDAGRCGSALETKVGLILIGTGSLMAWIGLKEKKALKIHPVLSPTVLGARATINWGSHVQR